MNKNKLTMKKIVIILSVFALIASSCGQSGQKQSATTSDSESADTLIIANNDENIAVLEESADSIFRENNQIAGETEQENEFKAFLQSLNFNPEDCNNCITQETLPYMDGYTVFAFLVETDKDAKYQYPLFDSYVLIREDETDKIKHLYYEKNAFNLVHLEKVEIDVTPYIIKDDKIAFGVRVSESNHSRISPSEYTFMSLFIPQGDKLICVLDKFTINEYSGFWDDDCEGEWVGTEKALIISDEKTNGYYNIIAKSTIKTLLLGGCEYSETQSDEIQTLHFVNGKYEWTPK
jgi:hypothetical protein